MISQGYTAKGELSRGFIPELVYPNLEVKWSEVTQSYLTLCDPMDCSLPGSSVHGIFQARVLEWVAIAFSRGSSQLRDWPCVSCTEGRFFTNEPPKKPVHIPFLFWDFWDPHISRSLGFLTIPLQVSWWMGSGEVTQMGDCIAWGDPRVSSQLITTTGSTDQGWGRICLRNPNSISWGHLPVRSDSQPDGLGKPWSHESLCFHSI